jgi:hypothetical protein
VPVAQLLAQASNAAPGSIFRRYRFAVRKPRLESVICVSPINHPYVSCLAFARRTRFCVARPLAAAAPIWASASAIVASSIAIVAA